WITIPTSDSGNCSSPARKVISTVFFKVCKSKSETGAISEELGEEFLNQRSRSSRASVQAISEEKKERISVQRFLGFFVRRFSEKSKRESWEGSLIERESQQWRNGVGRDCRRSDAAWLSPGNRSTPVQPQPLPDDTNHWIGFR
ncbi:hypothetical protein U1Q18_009389, partial [Sarracenia purpurea var. burkii]